MSRKGTIRIGISGWNYKPWRGVFYPDGLPQKRELEYASEQFRTIEINGTFYSMQRPSSFASWRERTPKDFVFSLKGPRYITHMKQLNDVKAPLANFLASGVLRLEEKLGPILWQFPPRMKFAPEKFEAFFAMLPHDTEAAAALAERHDDKIKGRAQVWLQTDAKREMRHAVEIRHDSFRDEAFIDLLRKYDIALVCADTVDWPRLMDLTSDFVYCRLHGSEELYASGYDDGALDDWARRIDRWAKGGEPQDAERVGGRSAVREAGRDVYVYFDNDMKVKAPRDAAALAKRLGL
ncbi:DUF72 domain-containing protein [Methyloligella halotolerans]|uniref:DUF72 domain-containing protein n=1 Tax=Methyloligella halotolerans TaxID=1177755 RepID=UPI00083D3C67|nr:DUF72 domain-containing protein [Methyloligella halotolerans]